MDTEHESETPPEQGPPPNPTVIRAHHSHEECRSMIGALSERVGDLETQLKTIISIKPDSTPVKGPWTHRRL